MFKNIFFRSISRNIAKNFFSNEYTNYQSKLYQFSKSFKPKTPHQLFTPFFSSKKSIKHPVILISSLTAVNHKIKSDESKENEKLQYAIMKGVFLIQRDKFEKGEKQLYEALRMANEQKNLDGILLIYTYLAEAAVNKKEFQKGEQILIDAKKIIVENELPWDDIRVLTILINLGMTYELLKRYDLANETYKFAHDNMEKKIRDTEEPEKEILMVWSTLLNYYGNFLLTQGQQEGGGFEKTQQVNTGLSYLTKALDVWIDVNGADNDAAVLMLNDLAMKFLSADDVNNAIIYVKKAIEAGEKLKKSQIVHFAYINLGMIYLKNEMYEEAKAACQEGFQKAKDSSNWQAVRSAKECLLAITKAMNA